MAIDIHSRTDRLTSILDEVAGAISKNGLRSGKAEGANAALRVELEENVRRIVQVYWTGFEINIPDRAVGLHLDIAAPKVHWAECYLAPRARNWVLCFHERDDGEMQLAYYRDYATPTEALKGFFDLASWYCLVPTDTEWKDVVYEVSEALPWSTEHELLAEASTSSAVQESLKKSTIIWMRWTHEGREFTMPVWYVLYQDKIYVLSGERQQTLPGAERIRECDVIIRWRMKNAQVAEIAASVRKLEPGPEWDEIAERIAEKRLNIPGLPEDTAKRWRDECVILELALRA